jgi:DNA-binding protein YbaB
LLIHKYLFLYRFAEKQAKIDKQAKELQSTMAKNAQELKDDEIEFQVRRR